MGTKRPVVFLLKQMRRMNLACRKKDYPAHKHKKNTSSDKHSTDDINKRVQMKDEPIVHIFSHVSHTMWVEHGKHVDEEVHNERWKLNDREVGWLTESMMATVGITSGVRKVLSAVQK